MLRKSMLTLGRPRVPVVAGSMATQLSAMNSRQAKIVRSWILALFPDGTSCGTSALMKLGGRGTWADAGCTAGRTHHACAKINKSEYGLDNCPAIGPPPLCLHDCARRPLVPCRLTIIHRRRAGADRTVSGTAIQREPITLADISGFWVIAGKLAKRLVRRAMSPQ